MPYATELFNGRTAHTHAETSPADQAGPPTGYRHDPGNPRVVYSCCDSCNGTPSASYTLNILMEMFVGAADSLKHVCQEGSRHINTDCSVWASSTAQHARHSARGDGNGREDILLLYDALIRIERANRRSDS